MTSQNAGLAFAERKIGEWDIPTIEFKDALCTHLRVPVKCTIINSTGPSEKQKKWKMKVASAVMSARRTQPWSSDHRYAISIGFIFHRNNHGGKINRRGQAELDVDNFVKPVIDAIAAGLFCPNSTEPQNIERWCYDDSNFNTLLIHRLPDARTRAGEGIAISVSARSAK